MKCDCRDVHARLTPFVDGELPEAEQAAVSAHLASCAACRSVAHVEQLGRQVLSERATALGEVAPPRLRAAVRRAAPSPRPRLRFAWVGR